MTFYSLDPGWVKNQYPDTDLVVLKILKFFDADPEYGILNLFALDPGSKMGKIRIRDPQHLPGVSFK